jgi:hypothetical protein
LKERTQSMSAVEQTQASGEEAINAEPHAPAAASGEVSAWSEIAEATTNTAFARAWLALLSRSFPAIRQSALFLITNADASMRPVGRWMADGQSVAATEIFARCAEQVLGVVATRQRGAVQAAPTGDLVHAGWPIMFGGSLQGVVVAEAVAAGEVSARRLLRHLQWGSAWVEAFLRRQSSTADLAMRDRTAKLLEIVNAVAAEARHVDACRLMANVLAQTFGCERVFVGLRGRTATTLVAAAHQASFDRKSRHVRAVEAAMDEAIDQGTSIMNTGRATAAAYVTSAHDALLAEGRSRAMMTIALRCCDVVVGAVTFERVTGEEFNQGEIDFAEAVCAVIGPLLADKQAMIGPFIALR